MYNLGLPLVFVDTHKERVHLYPLTLTRPTCQLRIGMYTIEEKWRRALTTEIAGYYTENHLAELFPVPKEETSPYCFVFGGVLPTQELTHILKTLEHNTLIEDEGGKPLLFLGRWNTYSSGKYETHTFSGNVTNIRFCTDIFTENGRQIAEDLPMLEWTTRDTISNSNSILGEHGIYIHPEARVECAVLNATNGPIIIDKGAEVMEGCTVRGPMYLGEYSTLKMQAKIYGDTTVGPHCKVGGEVGNSVFQGFSNKGHDGYLGNSVIGEWCNLGADTNNSNLKNNYAEVKLWNYESGRFRKTGLQFCGLIMGDHSKCSINTMFNTGTVVGVSANIFGTGFPRNFIPSFTWGGAQGMQVYQLNKVMETVALVFTRRNKVLDDPYRKMFSEVFHKTAQWRGKL